MFELSAASLDAFLGFGFKALIFLAGLAALIFVHELGHFLVARKFGVEVEKFSLGFGPRIISVTRGGTEYLLSAIPLGGYVKMKGEDYSPDSVKMEGSFAGAPVLHRLAIAFAGPLFNLLFAAVIYWGVYLAGVETLGLVTGSVKPESPAQVAGLRPGDKIVGIDGQKIEFWNQLQKIAHASPGKLLNIELERDSTLISLPVTPMTAEFTDLFGDKKEVGLIGLTPMVRNITYIKEGSAADRAGLKIGDRLLSVDGKPIFGWSDLKPAAVDKPGKELRFRVLRDDREVEALVTPESKVVKDEKGAKVEIGVIGIGMSGEMTEERYGPLKSVGRALQETGRLIYLIGVSIKKMVMGSIPANTIGGPILIFQIYGEQAEQGFNELVRLTALLSVNLGLLNLLPIPILDGGHILFFLIEAVKGKPLSEKSRERAQQVGLVMLLSLMIFAFYNDIMRIVG